MLENELLLKMRGTKKKIKLILNRFRICILHQTTYQNAMSGVCSTQEAEKCITTLLGNRKRRDHFGDEV
jgi:hypothetical protein